MDIKDSMKRKNPYSDQLKDIYPIIGVDESGKGEYLTPLTVCAFFIQNKEVHSELENLGVKDSKLLHSKKVIFLGTKLLQQKNILYKKITIYPEKYNQLYTKMPNMNQILSWAHMRAIKDILYEIEKKYIIDQKIYVIVDQFSTRKHLENNLNELSDKINFYQYVKAESHLAVAAASILSKFFVSNFLTDKAFEIYENLGCRIEKSIYDKLPIEYASSKNFAKKMAAKYGENILRKIVKYNFKTTKEILKELKK